jgi:hypothetical protein
VIPAAPMRDRIFGDPQYNYFHVPNAAFYFENAFEFLDSEGEWYLNESTGDLYYIPRAGEDMSAADVIAPAVQRLVSVEGSLHSSARNILFYGLVFEHSTWTRPDSNGYNGKQGGLFRPPGWKTTPGAIYLRDADAIQFERNTFQHIGAAGLGLDIGTHGNIIVGNVFTDISGSEIMVDTSTGRNFQEFADPREVPTGNVIRNNFVTKVGQQYESGVGIWVGLL